MAVTNEGQGGQFLWKELAKRDALVPMGHMGNAFDVAHAVLFLASDEAKYITATELVVDGGLSASVLGRPWEGGRCTPFGVEVEPEV